MSFASHAWAVVVGAAMCVLLASCGRLQPVSLGSLSPPTATQLDAGPDSGNDDGTADASSSDAGSAQPPDAAEPLAGSDAQATVDDVEAVDPQPDAGDPEP